MTGRWAGRLRETKTETETETHRHRPAHIHIHTHTQTQTYRHTDIETYRHRSWSVHTGLSNCEDLFNATATGDVLMRNPYSILPGNEYH